MGLRKRHCREPNEKPPQIFHLSPSIISVQDENITFYIHNSNCIVCVPTGSLLGEYRNIFLISS